MKNMKIFALLTALIMLIACVPSLAEEAALVRVAALKGPTGMAFAHMMSQNDGSYEFTLAGAPDELTAAVISGSIDIAAVPTNLACVLHNKTEGNVQGMAVITGGMLYVLEKGDSVQAVTDLEGKNVLSAGQGSTPEYIFNFILDAEGVSANTEYMSEHSEVVSQAVAGNADIVVLPEPHVTTLLTKDPSFRIALSVTDLYAHAAAEYGYADAALHMSTIIVNKAFAEKNPDAVAKFMADCEASILFAVENVNEAAKEIVENGIIASEAVAASALPNCALTFITGDAMKTALSPMLKVLFDANPKSVGGKLPGADFFFGVTAE